MQPETLTEILWIHDRQGYHELEVRCLTAPNVTPITFAAPSWYFNPSTLCNRVSNSSDTSSSFGLTDPWAFAAASHTTTPPDLTSPYVDTTVSPLVLLNSGRLDPITHPASFRIDPIHIHNLCAVFQQLVCSPDLSHITHSATTILIPDADQTWPKESQVHEIITTTQLQPEPFDEGSATFQGEPVACWGYEHTPPLTPTAPQTWLPFLRQKRKILFEKLSATQRPHAVIPIHIIQDDFQIQAHIYPSFMPSLLSTTYSPPFHTHSLSLFSFPINPHHNPSIKAYVDGPKASPHTSTTTPSRPPLSSYSFTRIITSHFNPSFTLATAAHLPTTQFNLAYSFNLPYFTFCGQPLTALSTVLRLLNSSTSQNTLPIGPTTCPITFWR